MNWPVKKLGDVANICSGGTPDRSNKSYYGGDIAWVKSGELSQKLIIDTEEKITKAGLENSSAKIVNEGTILMAMYGATVGLVSVLGVRAATNQAVCCIEVKAEVNKQYLLAYLKTLKDYLLANRVGGAQPNLNQNFIKNLKIPLPPLAEQQRIAALLDTADRILKQRESAIAKLDELEGSVFLKLINSSNAEDEIALSEVTANVKNISPAHLFSDQKFTYIDIGSVSNETKSIISENMIIGIDAPSRAKQEIKINDVLVSTVRPNLNAVAKVNHSYIKPVASTGFCVLRCDTTKILPQVVFSAVKSKKFIAAMVNSATGASYPAVTDKIVKSYKFPKIAMNEQLKFAEFIATCEKKRIHQNAQASKLKQLIQSLQHQSFAVN